MSFNTGKQITQVSDKTGLTVLPFILVSVNVLFDKVSDYSVKKT